MKTCSSLVMATALERTLHLDMVDHVKDLEGGLVGLSQTSQLRIAHHTEAEGDRVLQAFSTVLTAGMTLADKRWVKCEDLAVYKGNEEWGGSLLRRAFMSDGVHVIPQQCQETSLEDGSALQELFQQVTTSEPWP